MYRYSNTKRGSQSNNQITYRNAFGELGLTIVVQIIKIATGEGPTENGVEAIRPRSLFLVGSARARSERPAVVETEQTQAHNEANQNGLEQLREALVLHYSSSVRR